MNRRFKDQLGRHWLCEVDDGADRNVRSELGHAAKRLMSAARWRGLLADPDQLVHVVFAVCRDQADLRGIDLATFRRSLAQPVCIEAAARRLVFGLVRRWPSYRSAVPMLELLRRHREQLAAAR